MQSDILLIGAAVRNLLVPFPVRFLLFCPSEGISHVFLYPDDYLARLIVIAPEHICITSLECVEML